MHPLYEIPIIQPDLRHEETIIQAANSLFALQNVINEVFTKIDARIEKNNTKIQELNERIDVANEKGKKLIEMKSAIKIFSPAEYPILAQNQDIPMTFTNNQNILLNNQKSNKNDGDAAANESTLLLNSTNYKIKSPLDPVGFKSANDKLNFFHIRPTKLGGYNVNGLPSLDNNGLGAPPAYIDSVGTLLLFNEKENVYTNYRKSDHMRRTRKSKSIMQTTPVAAGGVTIGGIGMVNHSNTIDFDNEPLEDAPLSISNKKMFNHRKNIDTLFYSPGTIDAPQFDMPLDLPDLPGIADMSGFRDNSNITDSGIFLPDLPEISVLNNQQQQQDQSNNNFVGNTIQSTLAQPPPPPPPPSTQIVQIENKTETTVDSGHANLQQQLPPPPPPIPMLQMSQSTPLPPPPPPPPPPLPPIDILTKAPVSNTVEPPKTAPIQMVSQKSDPLDRGTLMEAIRQAGGKAILRSKSSIGEETKPKTQTPLRTGGNLMDDLHNKLAMRRKGISGSKESSKQAMPANPSNLMNRISQMIPPPPLKSTTKEKQTVNASGGDDDDEDDDADDDDDWE